MSWTSPASRRSWRLLLSLTGFNQTFSFAIFWRLQAAFLRTIIAASSVVLRRLGLRVWIFVRKHEVIILCGWRIHELALVIRLVTLTATDIGSGVCTLG